MAKRSLNITLRFAIVLVVLVPSLLAVAWAGYHGLTTSRGWVSSLYLDNETSARNVSDLAANLADADEAGLSLRLANSPAAARQIESDLSSTISPNVEIGIRTVLAENANNPAGLTSVRAISTLWGQFEQLLSTGALSPGAPGTDGPTLRQVASIFGGATNAVNSIVHTEDVQARRAYQNALASSGSSIRLMVIVLILSLLAAAGVVVWLIRSVLTRTLSYSAFASEIARGNFTQRLLPRGGDELAQLGRTLDDLAERRQSEAAFDEAQLEFTDTLQVTESEQEAHDLLKHHLERSVSLSTVTILNRNNSADRLEAVTTIAADSCLVHGLEGAKPRSCLAVRMARPVMEANGADVLLPCQVCSGCPGRVTCTPLLVGGEVIGSVLTNHDAILDEGELRSIRESVSLAAPVLGNLRNLAIAEERAATDALTGLPNKGAIGDTLKRMVAQSSRTKSPLAALMCDLDHFKKINDRFGHGSGDDALAAVGAVILDTLRSSDFAGRYGGEEFLILLPATDALAACEAAERIRSGIAQIKIPAIAQQIALSIGVAVFPDHAVDATGLARASDRALYAAKNAGRNRVQLFNAKSDAARNEPVDAATTGGNGNGTAVVDAAAAELVRPSAR